MIETSREIPDQLRELKEGKETEPNMTLFLIRHGESGKDKADPKRGLTDKGENQVKDTLAIIVNQLIVDHNPDFNDWDNPEKRSQAAQQALSEVEIHLRDSGTDRTAQQVWVEHDQLIELGVPDEKIIMPKSVYEWAAKDAPEEAGPGIAKQLKGVQGISKTPKFRALLDSDEYRKKVGAVDTMIAWAQTPEDEIPQEVETLSQMTARYKKSVNMVERVAGHQKFKQQHENRMVVIANSHASIVTMAASAETDISMKDLGEMECAEGMRFDFYGGGQEYQSRPVGKKLEAKVKELKG